MNEENKLIYPLNFIEMNVLNPDALIITYDEFNKIFNIEKFFSYYKKIIILYLIQSRNSGHYTCLFLNNGFINYFDSYGMPVDFNLDLLTKEQRVEYDQKTKKLSLLLKDYIVIYNNVLLQGKGTLTCGQFVTHRLHNCQYTEEQYIKKFFLNKKKSPDEIVADYCLNLLNKIY
jgi:hypothetical protein